MLYTSWTRLLLSIRLFILLLYQCNERQIKFANLVCLAMQKVTLASGKHLTTPVSLLFNVQVISYWFFSSFLTDKIISLVLLQITLFSFQRNMADLQQICCCNT